MTPASTTTYTLTVRGPNNQVLTKAVTVKVAGTTARETAPATGAVKNEVPRTAAGKPDLSGVYDFSMGGGRGGGLRRRVSDRLCADHRTGWAPCAGAFPPPSAGVTVSPT